MDFELQHIDIVSSDPTSTESGLRRMPHSKTHSFENTQDSKNQSQSLILDELTQQIEDLQTKLKLNYRKLLLYETENQKLNQEKNRYFFENKASLEQVQHVTEKMNHLEDFSNGLEQDLKLTSEKLSAYEKLCQAQSVDLKRLSKFHLKIKNIIKPYVDNLKTQLIRTQSDLIRMQNLNEQSTRFIQKQSDNINQLKSDGERARLAFDSEKVSLVQSYEEQVHFLSKEVVDHQQKVYTIEIENLRLKKANETKHFIENELVKFKRIHEVDQQTLAELKLKLNEQANQLQGLNNSESNLKNKLTQAETDLASQQALLDNTRSQLAHKIDENEKLHLRLKMFEKLNTNLSLSYKESDQARND